MIRPFTWLFALVTSLLLSAQASSAAQLSVEVPRLQVSEYHRPYVAIWISDERQQRVADVAVWYDVAMRNQEGTKWLPDLRQWWRRSGRALDMPVDGVSGATRPVGTHTITIKDAVLQTLASGEYILHVEAAREVGGREHLQLPFSLSAQGQATPQQQSVSGQYELGQISLNFN